MDEKKVAGKLAYLARKLKEPSTHAGLMGLLLLAGKAIPEPTVQAVTWGISVLFGSLAVLLDEKSA